jgi:DivIVA domain-containing protein
MITPQEIRQQTFKRAMRGYDKEEVHAFLQALAQEWEQQQNAYKDLKEELERTKASYRTLKEVEDMLHRTLMQAEQSARDTVENARQKAELKVREAEARSHEILRQGVEDRNAIQREIEELMRRRDNVYTQMQVFLKTQLERLQGFERAELPSYERAYPNHQQVAPSQREQPSSPQAPASEEADQSFFEESQRHNGEGGSGLFDDIMEEL